MYSWLFFLISLPLIQSKCDYASEWFNENRPSISQSNGHEFERYTLIRAKYPWKFELTQWNGLFEIRRAENQSYVIGQPQYIEKYINITDGILCQSLNGKRCIDFEIRFCLKQNECGISSFPPFEERIVGGIEARPHSLPWVASIHHENRHICGGTLIDDQHILTAAHCFELGFFPIEYRIVLGAHNLSEANFSVPIADLIFHPDYNKVTSENDIGLIKLKEPLKSFSDYVRPACLLKSARFTQSTNSYLAAGWGDTVFNPWSSSAPDGLRQTNLIGMSECPRAYSHFDNRKQICAGVLDFSKDTCQGDSGGGLMEKFSADQTRWIVSGVVSYGRGCAENGYPGIYARVSAYYDWIQSAITEMTLRKK